MDYIKYPILVELGVWILKPAFTEDGYLKVVLQDKRNIKTSTIHRLVAKSFLSDYSAGGYKWKYKDG